MAKNHSFGKIKRKSLIAALCAVTVTCTGLAAACAPTDTDEDENTPSKKDSALLKNGSFEFFDIPDDAVYLIKNVSDWSLGGGSSVKSGIIGTSEKDWDALKDNDLARKLDYNNDVGSSADDYVNYNSMRSRDILYKEPYAANLDKDKLKDDEIIKNFGGLQAFLGIDGDKDAGYTFEGETVYYNGDDGDFYFEKDFVNSVRKAVISNPETHYGAQEDKDGETYLGSTKVYKDEDGTLYDNEDKENTVANVLMLHNYTTDGTYNGIQQYYSSSSITLEANTAAEISVWVKTSDLKFDKGYSVIEEQDKGAFIEVVQTVSGNSLDSFVIKNINTEKIIAGAKADKDENYLSENKYESNGWLNYKIYVNACDFASSTIQLRLGLGRENGEQVTGYAFFDDVTVTKYRTLEDKDCGYSQDADKIKTDSTACNLASEADEKIFNADKELRATGGEARHAYDFAYSLDLASKTGEDPYAPVTFGDGATVTNSLTFEKDGLKFYAAAESNDTRTFGKVTDGDRSNYDLVKSFKALPTANDLTGIFGADCAGLTGTLFDDDNYKTDYSKILLDGLTGDGNAITVLPKYEAATSNMLLTLSAWGAAYTNTISSNSFKLSKDGYAIISFWVKTSDVDGTAATLRVYDKKDTDKKDAQSFTVNSTGVTTNFGDEKDIYNGWVPCFIFVANETDENDKQFNIDFCFGPTTVKSASFNYGWAAVANMHILSVDKDVYNLASSGDYTLKFAFDDEEKDTSGTVFDEAAGTYDIKKEISAPSNYNGLNGQNSSLTGSENLPSYDAGNTNLDAGLINKDYFIGKDGNEYSQSLRNKILDAFGASGADAAEAWKNAFGDDCYQPLIIINTLRQYVDKAEATETTYGDYYLLCEDGETADLELGGKKYRKVNTETDKFDETAEYYSLKEVCNYGFVGSEKTVSSSSYETVSVRVKVSGDATAYIYLVDPDNAGKVLSYSTPSVTFYYDKEGNVLDEEFDADWKETEHRKHIVYTLRTDGLYEDKDGKIFANLNNLNKSFKNYQFEHDIFYDENGKAVSFDNLVEGELYYTTDNKDTRDLASHYLTATDGTRVFEYKDGSYYYIVDKKTTDTKVENFDDKLARYSYEQLDEKYFVEIGNTSGEWVTVNFFIHTGSADKKYRLELWSGERGETGVDGSDYAHGAVAFDYSAFSVSSDNYDTVISEYESEIIEAYKAILNENGKGGDIPSNDENIYEYEKLIEELLEAKPDDTALADKVASVKELYEAKYYTYTLYDAPSYIPFNEDTAENGSTGYDYNADDFGELLAYFSYKDENLNSYNVFADYAAVDQSISLNTDNGNDDSDDGEEDAAARDLWLYISSIILVVVLLITLVAILVRNYLKKHRVSKGDKAKNKNVYRQRDRYIKKLHLVKEEVEEDTAPADEPKSSEEESSENSGEPEEEASAPEDGGEASEPAPEPEAAPESEESAEESADAPEDDGDKPE